MKNAALSLSLLESEITRLYFLQQSITAFAEKLEIALPSGSEPGWGLDRPLATIAKTMAPDLTEEEIKTCSTLPLLTLATRTAGNTTFSLLAALKLARGAPDVKDSVSADILIQPISNKQTEAYEDREDLLRHLPWLVQSALDYLCSESDYHPGQKSGSAEAARLLTAMIHTMAAHGLEMIVPKGHGKAPAKAKKIREEQGIYHITSTPDINPIPRLHPSLN